MKRSTVLKLLPLLAGGPAVWTSAALAQTGSDRPLTIIVSFPAGTPVDIFARALGEELTVALNRPVVVDNKPGAAQIVALSQLARSAPDGNTVMVGLQPNVLSESMLRGLPYTGMVDFEAIGAVGTIANVISASANLPVSNMKEFIALVQANPNKYSYGTTVAGSPGHLFLAAFNREAGLKAVHVPYPSYMPATMDMIGGQISYAVGPVSVMEFAKQGKIKALAITSPARDPEYPDLPTLDELGFGNLNIMTKYFLIAPKGTPTATVNRLNSLLVAAQASRAFLAKVRPIGGVTIPAPHTPAQATATIATDETRWGQLARTLNKGQ